MKTALLVTYYFPPSAAIAARRTGGLAKYLPELGWRVVVLTPRQRLSGAGSFELLETDDTVDAVQVLRRLLRVPSGVSISSPVTGASPIPLSIMGGLRRRAVTAARGWLTYPDATWGWYRPAVAVGIRFLEAQRADVILSSYGPATTHAVAAALAGRTGIPWVADYRDLWSTSPYSIYGWPLKSLSMRLEARVTSSASSFTSVSRAIVAEIGRTHPDRPVALVPNGFDPEEEVVEQVALDRQFTICHFGDLYGGKRDPELLFKAIAQLLCEGSLEKDQIALRFYGPVIPSLAWLADKYGLRGSVQQMGQVDRDTALMAERTAQVLLVVLWSSTADTGTVPGKVFEYLAAHRPILAIGTVRRELADLLDETGAGVQVVSLQEARAWVLDAYQQYVREGGVRYAANKGTVAGYSQLEMAKRFARVLDSVSENSRRGQ